MFEAGDTAIEFSLLDSRLLRVALWLVFLPTVAAELKRASAETGRSFVCQVTETRQESLRGTFPSEKALRARQLWSSSSGGGHEFGGAPLVVVRSNECLWCRSLFSSVGAALQHVREAYEVGHCKGGGEREGESEGGRGGGRGLTDGLR